MSALRTLAAIAAKGESETARVNACVELLNRGYGKAPQAHAGENGEGEIRVVVRHIVRGVVVDEQPLKAIEPPK